MFLLKDNKGERKKTRSVLDSTDLRRRIHPGVWVGGAGRRRDLGSRPRNLTLLTLLSGPLAPMLPALRGGRCRGCLAPTLRSRRNPTLRLLAPTLRCLRWSRTALRLRRVGGGRLWRSRRLWISTSVGRLLLREKMLHDKLRTGLVLFSHAQGFRKTTPLAPLMFSTFTIETDVQFFSGFFSLFPPLNIHAHAFTGAFINSNSH